MLVDGTPFVPYAPVASPVFDPPIHVQAYAAEQMTEIVVTFDCPTVPDPLKTAHFCPAGGESVGKRRIHLDSGVRV